VSSVFQTYDNVAHIPPPPDEEYFLMTFFGFLVVGPCSREGFARAEAVAPDDRIVRLDLETLS
jgi:hypothetical protein